MQEPEKLPSLEVLATKLKQLRKQVRPDVQSQPQGVGLVMRLGLELVAGVVVGAGVGLVLDRWLGTSPWLFVVCFFFGAAGGFLTLYRTANAMAKSGNFTDGDGRKNE